MAHKCRIHSAIAIKLLFERKNDESLVYVLAQKLHTPLPPRPELRTHVIDDENSALAHLPRHAPIEGGRVDDDGEVGTPLVGGANELLVEAKNFWKMADDFRNADDGEV